MPRFTGSRTGRAGLIALAVAGVAPPGRAQEVFYPLPVPGEDNLENLETQQPFAELGRKWGNWLVLGEVTTTSTTTSNALPARAATRPATGYRMKADTTLTRLQGRHAVGLKFQGEGQHFPDAALRRGYSGSARGAIRFDLSARHDLLLWSGVSRTPVPVANLPAQTNGRTVRRSARQVVTHILRQPPNRLTTKLDVEHVDYPRVAPKTETDYQRLERTKLAITTAAGHSWRRGYNAFVLGRINRRELVESGPTDLTAGVGLASDIVQLLRGEASMAVGRSFQPDDPNLPLIELRSQVIYFPSPLTRIEFETVLSSKGFTGDLGNTSQNISAVWAYQLGPDLKLETTTALTGQFTKQRTNWFARQAAQLTFSLNRRWHALGRAQIGSGLAKETQRHYWEGQAELGIAWQL